MATDEDHPSPRATLMAMQFGQFVDHDLTQSAINLGFNSSTVRCCDVPSELQHPSCYPILIPPDDPFYSEFNKTCMEFVRSSPVPREKCGLGPQEQINQVTPYLDASNVYGSSKEQQDNLRFFHKGKLRETPFGHRKPLLPSADAGRMQDCEKRKENFVCFVAGDGRVNEQRGLTAMHTLWMREHNRIASHLETVNPQWTDEQLYQETRKIVGAMMQHITFKEFLPLILGETVMKLFGLELQGNQFYNNYNITVNPGVANVFAAAAFRFGHSMIQGSLKRYTKRHFPFYDAYPLHSEFFRPGDLYEVGSIDNLMLGLINQNAQKVDEFLTKEIRNHLFQLKQHPFGMDLFALNIQRARDHGIPSYTAWREYCGFHTIYTFNELQGLMDDSIIWKLSQLYRTIDDVDLFPAGIAEKPVIGGMVGPTFACIIAQQFNKLKHGDRFWYENGDFRSSFKYDQLEEIRKSTLARILCDNLDEIDSIQVKVMEPAHPVNNPRVQCSSKNLPSLDFFKWREWTV